MTMNAQTPLPELSDKKLMVQAITYFFEILYSSMKLQDEVTFKSDDVVRYVHEYFIKYRENVQCYPDTICRYMREMKQDKKIDFECLSKKDRTFKLVKVGV